MLAAYIAIRTHLASRLGRLTRPDADERGQSTAEYALVLLGVAAIAMLVVAWASGGKVGDLLDTVFDTITDQAA